MSDATPQTLRATDALGSPAFLHDAPAGVSRRGDGFLLKAALLGLFSWSLMGKKFMLTMAVWLGLPPRVLTIPSHAITVGLSLATLGLVFLVARGSRQSLHWSLLPFIAFWGVYSFRIASEYALVGTLGAPAPDATYSVSYVAQRTFGSCLLPALAILINLQWGWHRLNRLLCLGMALAVAFAFLVMFRDNIFHFQHRMQPGDETGDFTTISSLQMGYAGLALLSFLIFEFFSDQPKGAARLLFLLGAGAVSLLLIVGSASRGPVLAAVFMMTPFAASLYARGRRAKFLRLSTAIVLIGIAAIVVAELTGSSLFDRLAGLHEDIRNQSAQADRLHYYRLALDAFIDAPFFGTQTTFDGRAYPHNLFLESLMSTGLMGTIPLFVALIYTFACGWRILVRAPELGWIPLNFYAFFCGAMFSGAIFTNSALWVCMAGTISAFHWLSAREIAEDDEP